MKNRRTIIVAFMLCAIMLLGVGYAAVTSALEINGSAEINAGNVQTAFDNNVFFSDATADTNGDVAYVDSQDNDIANFKSLNLAEQGNTAKFTFTIQNDSDLEVSVMPVLSYSGTPEIQEQAKKYFDVYSDWKVGDVVIPKTIPAKGNVTYTVTVQLKQTPPLAENTLLSGSFNILLTATSVQSGS